jgi:hypothetical protein
MHLSQPVGNTGIESMRSVVVVLPASIWAMRPMLRWRTWDLAGHEANPLNPFRSKIPAVVGKGLVGLGHAVRVFFFLHELPRPPEASISSAARRSAMVFSPRLREKPISQRMARA